MARIEYRGGLGRADPKSDYHSLEKAGDNFAFLIDHSGGVTSNRQLHFCGNISFKFTLNPLLGLDALPTASLATRNK